MWHLASTFTSCPTSSTPTMHAQFYFNSLSFSPNLQTPIYSSLAVSVCICQENRNHLDSTVSFYIHISLSLVNSRTTKHDFHLSLIHFCCWAPGLHPSPRFPNGPPSHSMLTARGEVWSTGAQVWWFFFFFYFFHFGWFLIGWIVIPFRVILIFLKVSLQLLHPTCQPQQQLFPLVPYGLHVRIHLFPIYVLFLWVNCSHLPFFGLANSSYLKAQLGLCLFHLSCSPPGRLLAPHLFL